MISFTKLSLRHKILSIALIGALGFIAYLGFTYKTAQANDLRLRNIQQINFPILDYTSKAWLKLFAARTAMQTAISEGEPDLIAEAKGHQKSMNDMLNEIARLEPTYANQVNALQQKFETYMSSAETLTRGMIDGNMDMTSMQSSAKNMNQYYQEFTGQLGVFRDAAYADFSQRLQKANDESNQAVITGLAIGLVVIAILLVAAFMISNTIASNINRIIHSLAGMATGKGDLTVRLQTKAQDEVGDLVAQFNAFITHLQLMIKVLANLSKGVTDRTEEVRSIARHTETGIMEQQAEIQQVATAVTEMAQTAVEVSKNAGEASKATDQADQESTTGQNVVSQNISAISSLAEEIESARLVIQNLAEEVQKIASASQDIRAIADQTNLLALNAAIEAARAGEQGRGFAVVADEVRTLAGRTGQSTNEIEDIIHRLLSGAKQAVDVMERSKERALHSVTQSQTTGESLASILSSVHTINEMNLLVASSAEEQSAVAEEVSKNIVRINEVSDKTVLDAKATAAATSALSEQANQLKAIVNEFRV
jgi:methyl-accepting chemotaxis protein